MQTIFFLFIEELEIQSNIKYETWINGIKKFAGMTKLYSLLWFYNKSGP